MKTSTGAVDMLYEVQHNGMNRILAYIKGTDTATLFISCTNNPKRFIVNNSLQLIYRYTL